MTSTSRWGNGFDRRILDDNLDREFEKLGLLSSHSPSPITKASVEPADPKPLCEYCTSRPQSAEHVPYCGPECAIDAERS